MACSMAVMGLIAGACCRPVINVRSMNYLPIARLIFSFIAASLITTTACVAENSGEIFRITSPEQLVATINSLKARNSDELSRAKVVVVAQGPVVKHLTALKGVGSPREAIEALQSRGVSFEVCTYAVLDQRLKLSELLPGVKHLDQGAPARIDELTSQGYILRGTGASQASVEPM